MLLPLHPCPGTESHFWCGGFSSEGQQWGVLWPRLVVPKPEGGWGPFPTSLPELRRAELGRLWGAAAAPHGCGPPSGRGAGNGSPHGEHEASAHCVGCASLFVAGCFADGIAGNSPLGGRVFIPQTTEQLQQTLCKGAMTALNRGRRKAEPSYPTRSALGIVLLLGSRSGAALQPRITALHTPHVPGGDTAPAPHGRRSAVPLSAPHTDPSDPKGGTAAG